MAIQTNVGPVVVDSDDLQFTHRGKTIAIKVRVSVWPVILGCVKQADGTWKVETDLTDDLFSSDPPNASDPVAGWIQVKGNGDMIQFIKNVILPNLNNWLAKLFPPVAAPAPVPTPAPAPAGTAIQQLHSALGSIKFVVAPDGTVKANI